MQEGGTEPKPDPALLQTTGVSRSVQSYGVHLSVFGSDGWIWWLPLSRSPPSSMSGVVNGVAGDTSSTPAWAQATAVRSAMMSLSVGLELPKNQRRMR